MSLTLLRLCRTRPGVEACWLRSTSAGMRPTTRPATAGATACRQASALSHNAAHPGTATWPSVVC